MDKSAEKQEPLVVLLGIRRIGKTSLLRAFLEDWAGVYVDLKGVGSLGELYSKLADGLAGSLAKLRKALEAVRGISVAGASVEIKMAEQRLCEPRGAAGRARQKIREADRSAGRAPVP